MSSTRLLSALFLVLVPLLGVAQGYVYDMENEWEQGYKTEDLPDGAVLAGMDPDGYYIYVGRAVYSSSVYPASIVPELGRAYYNTDTVGNYVETYSVLVSNATVGYEWVRSFDGYREKNAVSVGTSSTNFRVFICRAKTEGGLLMGTLLLEQRLCTIKYSNHPLRQFEKYETLIKVPRVYNPMP